MARAGKLLAMLFMALLAPVSAHAATVISFGTYGAGSSVYDTGSFGGLPGTYKVMLSLSTPAPGASATVINTIVTNFFCHDPNVSPTDFYCGGDDVPLFMDLAPQNPLLYSLTFKVNPPSTILTPGNIVTRTENLENCCQYVIDFQSQEAGSYQLSYTALSAAPEPSTWALAIIGMMGIAWVMRRRTSGPAPARA